MLRTIKNKIRNRLWVFLKARWTLLSGIQVTVADDSDWFVYNEIFANKEYDAAISLFLAQKISNPVILDLGANVGYFSTKVADELLITGITDFHITAVEASTANFATLQQRMSQPILTSKINCHFGLAGYREGSANFASSSEHYGHAVSTASAGADSVRYLDVEKLIPPGKKPDFLKCDIEGSEEVFIEQYLELLKSVSVAVFEFHAGDCDVDNCKKMLAAAGLHSKGVVKEEKRYRTTVEIFSRS